MKLRIFILFLFLPILSVQAGIIDSLMIHPRDSIGLTSDSLVLRYLQESGIPISDNNKVKLLKSGREKFIDLFEAIREAKHHVHLEYFNFRNDSIANALFALLAEKVKEGVEVRAMFDAFGNWSNNKPLKKKHLKKIREQGIEIVKFDPFTFPYINHAAHRDHRKIAVIDGKVAYTGGMNIADYYINGLPKIGTWRDMHTRIEGDAVNDLQEIFLTIWNKETKQNVGGAAYFPQHEEQTDSTNIVVAIVDRTPKKNSRMLSHAYAMSIYSAQKNVHIVNPPVKVSFATCFRLFPDNPELTPLYVAPPIAPVTAPPTMAAPRVPSVNPSAPAATIPTPPVRTPTPIVAPVATTAIPTFFQSTFPN